jgi:hypothetical protein
MGVAAAAAAKAKINSEAGIQCRGEIFTVSWMLNCKSVLQKPKFGETPTDGLKPVPFEEPPATAQADIAEDTAGCEGVGSMLKFPQ